MSCTATHAAEGVFMAEDRSLQEQLDLVRAYWELIQPESVQAFDEVNEYVAESAGAPGLRVGDVAPDFTLPDALGAKTRLSDLLRDRHVVLAFYRGSWCPYCNLQLRAYDRVLDNIDAAGGALVAVSPMTPERSLAGAEKNDLRFRVLSDHGNAVARAYRLVFQLPPNVTEIQADNGIRLEDWNDADAEELPVPGTFVIDRDGTIVLAHVNPDYTRRLDPEAIVAALHRIEHSGARVR